MNLKKKDQNSGEFQTSCSRPGPIPRLMIQKTRQKASPCSKLEENKTEIWNIDFKPKSKVKSKLFSSPRPIHSNCGSIDIFYDTSEYRTNPHDLNFFEEIELNTLKPIRNMDDSFFGQLHDEPTSSFNCPSASILDAEVKIDDIDFKGYNDYTKRPQMTCHLPSNSIRLDFSALECQRGDVNIYSSSPLARVQEFHYNNETEESQLLNILADEFESLEVVAPSPKKNLWKIVKQFTVGVSPDEFDDLYPWAKYSVEEKSLMLPDYPW